jgi:hypothetical protein
VPASENSALKSQLAELEILSNEQGAVLDLHKENIDGEYFMGGWQVRNWHNEIIAKATAYRQKWQGEK